ncbi:MAG: acyltransferase [Muribaculaceae bacterium]|nr:acyltransferase [Muribaculaceae bacterium]
MSSEATNIAPDKPRIVFLDYLRVISCLMVIIVHACEFYYIGDSGVEFALPGDRFWVSLVNSAFRESVPLFVMASSFLLVPLTCGTRQFFRRRFSRVFVPFMIWSVLYAVLPVLTGTVEGDIPERLCNLTHTFNYDAGHLWFIYMLIGVYLTMPIISPWLRQVSKRGEEAFLAIWAVTTLWDYLYPSLGNIWGKALWNEFHALYYFSGFIGYVVMAHYIREHVHWSMRRTLAVSLPLIAVGYAVTAGLFYIRSRVSCDYSYVEQPWKFCTFNVAMLTAGCFLLMRKINYTGRWLYAPVQSISRLSYGVYLMHIFVLGIMYRWLAPMLSTPVSIALTGILTFAICCVVCKALSYIPGSKWLIG